MSTYRVLLRGLIALALTSALTGGLFAQTGEAKKPEPAAAEKTTTASSAKPYHHFEWHPGMTAQEIFDKLGLSSDPGPDPDPKKVFMRWERPVHIEKFERRHAIFKGVPEGYVRPYLYVNLAAEIYRQTDKYIWVYLSAEYQKRESEEASAEAAEPAEPGARGTSRPYLVLNAAQIETVKELKKDFLPVDLASSGETLHFKDGSKGLPQRGSWRDSLDVADMNGDGHVDLITPPQRGGASSIYPNIFLGDGAGEWKFWKEPRWPVTLNYGGVAVADFNKDGNKDLAFAVHLQGPLVLLGDGKGGFVNSSKGLPKDFPTRKLVVADVDGDGYPDLVVLTEGPEMHDQKRSPGSRLRFYLNRDKGTRWVQYDLSGKDEIAGDWLDECDLNGDGRPDFVPSSIFFNAREHIFLSSGKGKWTPTPDLFLPKHSYYLAMTSGHFTSKKRDDAIVSYVRIYPKAVNPKDVAPPAMLNVTGLDMVSVINGKPVRKPIVRYEGRRSIFAMGSGDFDGDGNLDVAFVLVNPRELKILLGDGRGGFHEAKFEGIQWPDNPSYDIKVADVNGDGRPDIVMMFEESDTKMGTKNGSLRVWLNEGATGH